MSFLNKLFSSKASTTHWSDTSVYENKVKMFEQLLGPSHTTVITALTGWELGGPVDLWVFPNHIEGTIFSTMQLVFPGNKEQVSNSLGKFELAAATRYKPSSTPQAPAEGDELNPNSYEFQSVEIRSILSGAARYSCMTRIEPGETAEVEPETPGEPNTCLMFDTLFQSNQTNGLCGSLLVIKVHPSELDYARENGSDALFSLLKDAGVYPFSDLDRKAIV